MQLLDWEVCRALVSMLGKKVALLQKPIYIPFRKQASGYQTTWNNKEVLGNLNWFPGPEVSLGSD